MGITKAQVGVFWRRVGRPALASLFPFAIGCNQVFNIEDTELQQPNYYACDCDCSQRVVAPQGASVLSLPGQLPQVGVVSAGSQGALVDGPVDQDFDGDPATWWQVQFDDGVLGWVQESLLAPANETLVRKEARVCLPQPFNPYLGGTMDPTLSDLQGLCGGPVADEAQSAIDQSLASRFLCQCGANDVIFETNNDASCTVACPGGGDVCLVAGSDPPDPTPEPMEAALFRPTSECVVSGPLDLLVGGHAPKDTPTVRGTLQIQGRACVADEDCRVGMSYALTGDPIEFDSGSIFASDPRFVDLAVSGATVPDAIPLGQLLGFYVGGIPADTAFSTLHGRRSTSATGASVTGRNTEGVALAVNWANRTCRLSGQLVGAATDADDGTLDVQADVALDGALVNQPPVPDAGPDQTVECTDAAGADVTLDASGTVDADGNLAFYVWRSGAADGPPLAAPSADPVLGTRQALGVETYFVQAVDDRFSADVDAVQVRVADTTAPRIECNAPATIDPTDAPGRSGAGLAFTATAADDCTGVSEVAIQGFTCARAGCGVGSDGATLAIHRSGGVGEVIRWEVVARDSAGNESRRTCELSVARRPQ